MELIKQLKLNIKFENTTPKFKLFKDHVLTLQPIKIPIYYKI